MKVEAGKKSQMKNQTLVVFSTLSKDGGKVQTPGLSREYNALLQDAIDEKTYVASKNATVLFRNCGLGNTKHVLFTLVGADKSPEAIRQAAASAHRKLEVRGIDSCAISFDNLSKIIRDKNKALSAAVEGFHLANYDYILYKSTTDKKDPYKFKHLYVESSKALTATQKKAIEDAEILTTAINFARKLGDDPGNICTPDALAKFTQAEAKNSKLKVTVWDKARIKKEGFGGLYGVSLGSGVDPRFIILEYKGAAASKKPVCFVGKGLTFDCGGISIKPSNGMEEMKYDMCGGANVIGAMLAIAKLKLKVNAIAFVPASENMPGEMANKPGDILKARNGKTVEVFNTDAEGRLILMDALSYASEKKPAVIFDAATLTGAMVIALSNIHTGVFTRDKKLMGKIQKAADAAEELVWPMPLTDFNSQRMKGKHADLQNIADTRYGGSSNAAAFLENFVDKSIPWAHFDIAGTAWNCSDILPYTRKKGATGAMIRTFVELAKTY